jgi:hypothetical protein
LNIDGKLIRPSWWHCLWIVPLASVGFGLFTYFLWTGIKQATSSLTQIVVPGEKDVAFATPGRYTIFLEKESVVDGCIYSASGGISGLKCTVESKSDSEKLPLRNPSTNVTYTLPGRSGRSVLQFNATKSATYTVGCSYPDGASDPQTVVAVGTGVDSNIFSTVFRSLTTFFSTIGGCIAIFLGVLARRDRCKRSFRDQTRATA